MTIREAVAVFDSEEEMLDVIDELGNAGIDLSEMSVLPPVETVEKQMGHRLNSVTETVDDPAIGRAVPLDMASFGEAQGVLIGAPAYVGAMSMAIASAVIVEDYATIAVLVTVGASLGAIVGYFLASWLKKNHQRYVNKQLERGGLVLWVHIRDKIHEDHVTDILSHHVAHDVHIHNIPDAD